MIPHSVHRKPVPLVSESLRGLEESCNFSWRSEICSQGNTTGTEDLSSAAALNQLFDAFVDETHPI